MPKLRKYSKNGMVITKEYRGCFEVAPTSQILGDWNLKSIIIIRIYSLSINLL